MTKAKSTIRGRKLTSWPTSIFIATILALGAAQAQAEAVLSVTNTGDNGCYDLLAGQDIDVGDVCYAVDGNDLTVSYTTDGDWELTEAHLWVGDVQDGYPKARNGNPKIGNFPYNAGDITGATSYTFSVPLGSVQSFIDLGNLDQYCPSGIADTLFAMAHAALQLVDSSGTVLQTETGWSDGEGAVDQGSWATRSAIELSVTCDGVTPEPATLGQETAIMFGNIELNNGSDGICDEDNNSQRWGWQEGLLYVDTTAYRREIWAAAGNNDLTNGTLVGHVDIVVSAEPELGNVTVTPVLNAGFTALETHIYIGTEPVCSSAFGRDWASNASTDIDTSNGVYVGVHFSIEAECGINAVNPDNFCD